MKKTVLSWIIIILLILVLVPPPFGVVDIVRAHPGSWWSDWSYSKKITIDHTKVDATLTNFPILFHNTSSDFVSHALANGSDFVFVDSTNTTQYNHEIESYNSTTGELIAWVNITTLSADTDTVLYLYYGNNTCGSQENIAGTWDSNYLMVQHFNETTGTHYDSTSNDADSTAIDVAQQGAAAAGIVSGGDEFVAASDDNVDIAVTLGTTMTAEFWINPHHAQCTNWAALYAKDNTIGIFYSGTGGVAPGKFDFYYTTADHFSDTAMSDQNWHYCVVANSAGSVTFYLDGSSDGTAANGLGFAGTQIGTDNSAETFDGYMDEIRFSNVARNSSWINTTYNTTNSPSTFLSVRTEQSQPSANNAPTQSAQKIWNATSSTEWNLNATGVSLTPTSFNVTINDADGDKMNITLLTNESGTWTTVNQTTGSGLTNGTYNFTNTSWVDTYTTYYISFNVTDGTDWINSTFHFTTDDVTVTNPTPTNGSTGQWLNKTINVTLNSVSGKTMYIIFQTNRSGTWENIGSQQNGENNSYSVNYSFFNYYNTTYYWRVLVNNTDNEWHNHTYHFTTVVPSVDMGDIGDFTCWGVTDIIRDKDDSDDFYAIYQHWQTETSMQMVTGYSTFNRTQGKWITDGASGQQADGYDGNDTKRLSNWTGVHWNVSHPSVGYWDGEYHLVHNDITVKTSLYQLNETAWDDFYTTYPPSPTSFETSLGWHCLPSVYSFNNTHAWVVGTIKNTSTNEFAVAYWEWEDGSFSSKTVISSTWIDTPGTYPLYNAFLTPMNRTKFYIYYQEEGSDTMRYVNSTDGGTTWGTPSTALGITYSTHSSRPLTVRYGNNFYMILSNATAGSGGPGTLTIYNSTDCENWGGKTTLNTDSFTCPVIILLNQQDILWAASNKGTGLWTNATLGCPHSLGDEEGGVHSVPEMLSYAETPTDCGPADTSNLGTGVISTTLNITVHGNQTYDIAFYWSNGTLIGEDKLLVEGENATYNVSSLSYSTTYQWYTVARGTTYKYTGVTPDNTTDENRNGTFSFTTGAISQVPVLSNPSPTNGSTEQTRNPTLSITVSDPQGNLENVTFRTNASGSWANIGYNASSPLANGTYQQIPTTMSSYSTTYYWSINATDDGNHWTNETYHFTTESSPTDYTYYKQITINHSLIDTGLTNFPVLVNFSSDSDLASHAQSDADDIKFMDGISPTTGTQYHHEIENYNSGTGELWVWVNITSISSSVDTIFYMHYGNNTCSSQENITNTWNSNYTMVQHLNESSGSILDSTSNDIDGTNTGATATSSCKIAGGYSFGRDGDYISMGDTSSVDFGTGDWSMSCWALLDTVTEKMAWLGKDNTDAGTHQFVMLFDPSDADDKSLQPTLWNANDESVYYLLSDNNVITDTTDWHYIVIQQNGSNLEIYLDGVLNKSGLSGDNTGGMKAATSSLYIGGRERSGNNNWWGGDLDEVRISDTARNSSWINATYNNVNISSTFLSIGSEETSAVNTKPTIENPVPANQSTDQELNPQLSITVNDTDGDTLNITWYSNSSGSWQVFNTNNSVACNQTFRQTPTNFSAYSTTYYWNLSVNDGTDTNDSGIYHFTTRAQYVPSPPSSFTATKYNRTVINISWTNAGSNNTYIEWNSTEGWTRGQGTTLDNSTNTTYNHTDLSFGTTYYYQAWSWNTTDSCWSTTNSSDNATTDSNTAPTQSGEAPANTSTGISTTPTLYVVCTDADSDMMTATWRSNSSGVWVTFATNSSINTGTNITQTNSNFSGYTTTYYWSVNVTDSYNWNNETYSFTTRDAIISISINQSGYDFGTQNTSLILYSNASNPNYFGITNDGEENIDLKIQATNMTNTTYGYTWVLANTPSTDQYALACSEDGNTWTNISTDLTTFYSNLVASAVISIDLRLKMPTSITAGYNMGCTITISAIKH